MFKTILKFGFAGCILIWLVQKGDLDFSLIPDLINHHPGRFLLALFLIILSAIGTSYRWKILLKTKGQKHLSTKKVMGLTWIGLLFSSLLPGAVTGDVIKVVYAKDLDPSLSKAFLITSALMDRIIGLLGLLFLLGICSIFHYSELVSISISLKQLLHFNFLLLLGALFFLITLFLPKKIQTDLLTLCAKIPLVGKLISSAFSSFWELGASKARIIQCLVMSIFFQIGNVLSLFIVSFPYFNSPMNLSTFFTFVPLGLMSTALPISPSGMGVGHAIFGTLFSYFGILKGASLFNLYFICQVLINALGVFPFLLMHRPKKEAAFG